LLGYYKYNSDLLNASTIAQITGHFQNLITAIVANYQQQVAQLPMLSVSERQELIYDWNTTQTNYDLSRCLHQLIEAQVERTPDAIAVIFENQHLTYRELNCRANQLMDRSCWRSWSHLMLRPCKRPQPPGPCCWQLGGRAV
jgi:non-ribosomal peptide synthetase component F